MADLTRTWTYTSLSNTSSGNKTMTVTIDKFTVSGDTSSYVGSVSRIVISHWHTATKSDTIWPLCVVVTLGDGTTLTSDTVRLNCNGTIVQWVNTITLTGSDATAAAAKIQANGIRSISIEINGTLPASPGTLYWRAVSQYPITMAMTFVSKMPSPPVLEDVAITWPKTTAYYSGVNTLLLSGSATFDSSMGADFLSGVLTLSYAGTPAAGDPTSVQVECEIIDPEPLASETSANTTRPATLTGNLIARFGPISTTGNVNWMLVVTDTNNNTASTSGSFTVQPYTRPTLSGFLVERYTTPYNDDPTPSPTGTSVWVSFSVSNIMSGQIAMKNGTTVTNTGTIGIIAKSQDGTYVWQDTIATDVAAETTYSVTRSATIDTNVRNSSDTYIYTLWVEDAVSYTETLYTLTSASALMNIEKKGVAVGKLVDTGTAENPVFDVNMKTVFRKDVSLPVNSTALSLKDNCGIEPWTPTTAPLVRRVGPYVFLSGHLNISSSGITHSGYLILDGMFKDMLPTWARPMKTTSYTQGSMYAVSGMGFTNFFFQIEVTTAGKVILYSQIDGGTIDRNVNFYIDGCWLAGDVLDS